MQLDTNQVLRTGMAKQNFVVVPGLQSITGKAYVATVDKKSTKKSKASYQNRQGGSIFSRLTTHILQICLDLLCNQFKITSSIKFSQQLELVQTISKSTRMQIHKFA